MRIRFDNGLNVILFHQPGLTRSAAALRVHAGSHDEPRAYPGLAHFLEHLVFLGSERFPARQQGLIAYVQANAGEVNASTRERHTDYFFELPPAAFEGALARLCDMLVSPLLRMEDQLRELDVLHAEFVAWSQAAGRIEQPLSACLPSTHPASRFHAGNRYGLPLHAPAFQQALWHRHRQVYQPGQISLVLAGPQPLAELHALACLHAGHLPAATRVDNAIVPTLLPLRRTRLPPPYAGGLRLAFVLDDLPDGSEDALDFLCFCLASWDRSVAGDRPSVPPFGPGHRAAEFAHGQHRGAPRISALLFSWLEFYASQKVLAPLSAVYARVQRRRMKTMQALALVRHWLSHDRPPDGLCVKALGALSSVLTQLRPERLIQLGSQADSLSPQTDTPCWQLSPPNPFLLDCGVIAMLPRPDAKEPCCALRIAPESPADHGQGALFLRWQPDPAQPGPQPLLRTLNAHLAPLIGDAGQAGLQVRLILSGAHWELVLTGLTRVMPQVLQALLARLLDAPAPYASQRYDQRPAQMLIRQLLQVMDGGRNFRFAIQ